VAATGKGDAGRRARPPRRRPSTEDRGVRVRGSRGIGGREAGPHGGRALQRVGAPARHTAQPLGYAARVAEGRLHLEKKRFRPSEQDRPDIRQHRAAYVAAMASVDPGRLIFIDESGCNVSMALRYGRAVRGQRVIDTKSLKTGHNRSARSETARASGDSCGRDRVAHGREHELRAEAARVRAQGALFAP
jgi:hypothetical protein